MTPDQATSDRLTPAELGAWRGMLRVHSSLIAALDADLVVAHGLPLRSYEVLLHLDDAADGRLRMTELSRSVLLSASGVSRLVDRLQQSGYVRRERCGSDGRGYFTVLTAAGRAKLKEARATHLAGVRRLFLGRLDDGDLPRLAATWERLLPGAAAEATGAPPSAVEAAGAPRAAVVAPGRDVVPAPAGEEATCPT